jgi:hypothetical protein
MKTQLFLLVVVALSQTSLYADDDLTLYRSFKTVSQSGGETEEIIGVPFDSDIFDVSRDGFDDIRILDGQSRTVPFLIDKVTERRTRESQRSIRTEVASLTEKDENEIAITVLLDKKASSADGFHVRTPLKDYERQVSVFGSNNGQEWTSLVTDSLIFDYSRYMDISNTEIKLPENTYRQFRVIINDVTDEKESPYRQFVRKSSGGQETETIETLNINRRPFRIDHLQFWHTDRIEEDKRDTIREYPIAEIQISEDTEKQLTNINIRTRREPLTEFTLETDSRNFSRAAEVQIPVQQGVQTIWRAIGQATLSLVDVRGFQRKRLTLTFPEQRHEQYRIVVHNQDNPILKITGANAQGSVYRAVFLVSPDTEYRVLYGSETATAPVYDTAAVLASLEGGYQPIAATLGEESSNPDFDKSSDVALFAFLESKLLLGGVVALMVVVLGFVLFQAVRRIDTSQTD